MTFGQVALVAGVCIMACVPWTKGFSRVEEGYYDVVLDGRVIGAVSEEMTARDAYDRARIRVTETRRGVYVDADLQVVKNTEVFGADTDPDELERKIYEGLLQDVVEMGESTYTLKVGDTSVVLESLEAVSQVMDAVKDEYDTDGRYQVVMNEKDGERFGTVACELRQASIEPENKPIVMAGEETQPEDTGETESVRFLDAVCVEQNYTATAPMVLEEAIAVIKEALQVETVETIVYTEEIPYTTVYVEDDSLYTDESIVLQSGVTGQKHIQAEIVLHNGAEAGRTILSEEVLAEPVQEQIAVGTEERPIYILPLKRPVISDIYGERWGTFHYGMDFACGIGTPVLAVADGIVTEAYYHHQFGNTVLLTHPDGTRTRYAHMSELLVQEGQTVTQGQTVGLSGNTGDSTGPHLHFEVIKDGKRVDPQVYLY